MTQRKYSGGYANYDFTKWCQHDDRVKLFKWMDKLKNENCVDPTIVRFNNSLSIHVYKDNVSTYIKLINLTSDASATLFYKKYTEWLNRWYQFESNDLGFSIDNAGEIRNDFLSWLDELDKKGCAEISFSIVAEKVMTLTFKQNGELQRFVFACLGIPAKATRLLTKYQLWMSEWAGSDSQIFIPKYIRIDIPNGKPFFFKLLDDLIKDDCKLISIDNNLDGFLSITYDKNGKQEFLSFKEIVGKNKRHNQHLIYQNWFKEWFNIGIEAQIKIEWRFRISQSDFNTQMDLLKNNQCTDIEIFQANEYLVAISFKRLEKKYSLNLVKFHYRTNTLTYCNKYQRWLNEWKSCDDTPVIKTLNKPKWSTYKIHKKLLVSHSVPVALETPLLNFNTKEIQTIFIQLMDELKKDNCTNIKFEISNNAIYISYVRNKVPVRRVTSYYTSQEWGAAILAKCEMWMDAWLYMGETFSKIPKWYAYGKRKAFFTWLNVLHENQCSKVQIIQTRPNLISVHFEYNGQSMYLPLIHIRYEHRTKPRLQKLKLWLEEWMIVYNAIATL